jgi:DNA polymerase III delta prime subunit
MHAPLCRLGTMQGFETLLCPLHAPEDRTPIPYSDIVTRTPQVTLPAGRHKIVILDEADSMTSSAQQAMRRTMELYSSTTRFALACNNSSEIIEPIQSRCAILRFTKLSDPDLLERLQDICKKEDVKYELPGLEAIIFTADGDLRSGINALQSTASGFDCVDQASGIALSLSLLSAAPLIAFSPPLNHLGLERACVPSALTPAPASAASHI